MAIKTRTGYQCLFCDKEFTSEILADAHRDKEHDFVLLPILKEELIKLYSYLNQSNLFEGNMQKSDYLSPRLLKRIRQLSNNLRQKPVD